MARSTVSASSVAALPELLERSGELAALARVMEAVRASGSGALCLIGGEAGVGKTALVRRFCNQQSATRVLWGACDPLFTPQPLGPLMDIASAVGGDLLRLGGSRARPYEVTSALLSELRAGAPAIVVLEDLQWADEATLDVLRLLSGRVESASALVIATYRDDELGRVHPLRFLLGEIPRHESVSRIKLQPLSAAAVAALADGAGVDARELYRRTAGNPFFVTEALASADAEQIPQTVRDAVLARAARLSPDARALLDAVAVVVQHAELWLLEAVSPQQLSALGECLSSGMLARQNGAVAFRHELARRQQVCDSERPRELRRRLAVGAERRSALACRASEAQHRLVVVGRLRVMCQPCCIRQPVRWAGERLQHSPVELQRAVWWDRFVDGEPGELVPECDRSVLAGQHPGTQAFS